MRVSALFAAGLSLVATTVACSALLGDFSPKDLSATDGGGTGGDGSTVSEGGGDDGGGTADGGGSDGGSDAGTDAADAGIFGCSLQTRYQRGVVPDGGTVSADELFVYRTSMDRTLALVRSGNDPSLAFDFRSDRPGDVANMVPLRSAAPGTAGDSRLLSVARHFDGLGTYVLAADHANNAVFFDWSDQNGIMSGPATAGPLANGSIQAAAMVATTRSMFYGFSAQGFGSYADAPPNPWYPTESTNITSLADTSFGDGPRSYRLSDDSVMLLYHTPDFAMHQAHFPAHSSTPSSDRVFYAGNMQPVVFQSDPSGATTNVDVGVALPIDDAGQQYGLFTATMSESALFTFDVTRDLKPVTIGGPIGGVKPCTTNFPGKLVVLLPGNPSGFDLVIIDVPTAKVDYSLMGANNLLHGDSAIVTCGISTPKPQGTGMVFDVIWTENQGAGAQTLNYAPLFCGPQ